MDPSADDFAGADVDTEMTVLQPEDVTQQNLEASDEVESLRNSLREAVRDDNVRPKMQCLMMDTSFSMVTVQGEDSGIAWETTPGQCPTPRVSEAGSSTVELASPVPTTPVAAGSHPAGKIIFVMDEELIARQKKSKERVSSQKSKVETLQFLGRSSENISGRPEWVGVSQPNVKPEGDGDEEEPADPLVDKEQRLFSIVSEGFEILNIVVPPKLATVDEEESKEMLDNLSYLEETPIPKASDETMDNDPLVSTNATRGHQVNPSPLIAPRAMDPPGAPVARPPGRGAARPVDYFEAFTLIDAQAPGGPAVIAQGQVEPEAEDTSEIQHAEAPVQPKDASSTTRTPVENENSDTVSLEGITSELLDDVFYGGTHDYSEKGPDEGGMAKDVHPRLPSKPSGSTLFGSQEDILTPIYLPEGPPKIIDPILLEEPKAMAFLYTDLYEEALGSRKKEEDTESLTSEKSFHSRHSDREARGYLEKFVLIDETPALQTEASAREKCPEEGLRVLTQDLYEFGDFISKPEPDEVPKSEEEFTDFFRSSANSSPCDVDPFPQALEEDEPQSTAETKPKSTKSVSITVKPVAEIPEDSLSFSSVEFPLEEPEWGITDDHPEKDDVVHTNPDVGRHDVEVPVAPIRKKDRSQAKTCLDLTPLTPVDLIMQEKEEAGVKEKREEEEKETASPVETADEGDGEESIPLSSEVTLSENEPGSSQTKAIKDSGERNLLDTVEGQETEMVEDKTRATDAKQTEAGDAANNLAESPEAEVNSEEPTESAKAKRQCVIL
ncbi:cardiomyopathy-associated protein 5 [Betta splendens]|uniref:Cardiomyopathy-associated protein 5 n=1 Tax=Betta splendens TaxID=158456 RepID=A0A6P7P6W8_BETSP|nr:cardiomyopathy-associated protein 5 [Betta splendens]